MNKTVSSLSQFIEEYPLYSKFGVNQPIEAADLAGLEFNFFCNNEKQIQLFKLAAAKHNGVAHPGSVSPGVSRVHLPEGAIIDFTELFSGICQSCGNYKISLIISGGTQNENPKYFIRKIGQYPAPEASVAKLPKEVFDFLSDEDRELYRKGLKNLELGYGLGAFAYFKRMIENEIGKIIETISNPYSPQSNRIAEVVAAYKTDQQKSKLIEDITPHLPESLKEHGANILLLLNDTVLTPLHELTEEECIKKSKDIDTLFRYLLKKINEEKIKFLQ